MAASHPARYALPPTESALRLPAARRISTPASARLAAITEDPNIRPPAKHQARRFSWRSSATYAPSSTGPRSIRRYSGTTLGGSSQDTTVNAPPPYTWVSEPIHGVEIGEPPVEGDKLAELRRGGQHGKRTRGGWGRLCLILLLILVVVGLGVGLGVGLTIRRRHRGYGSSEASAGSSANSTTSGASSFPLGSYSFNAALRTQSSDCTTNAATWRCAPYTVYNASHPDPQSSSLYSFYWTISNTSLHYATNGTTITTTGTPSNLTISSAPNSNPSFSTIPLTYVNEGSTASVRYTFNFSTAYYVVPSASLTSSSASAVCYYNSTILSGSIYSSHSSVYPNAMTEVPRGIDTSPSGDLSAYATWPYAVEIEAMSPGAVTCYEAATNGQLGSVISGATMPEAGDESCACGWRNF